MPLIAKCLRRQLPNRTLAAPPHTRHPRTADPQSPWCSRRSRLLIAIGLLIASSFVTSTSAQSIRPQTKVAPKGNAAQIHPLDADFWETIYLGQQRIGYSHEQRRMIEILKQPLVDTEITLHMRFKRFGDVLTIETQTGFADRPNGEMSSFEFRMDDGRSNDLQVTGLRTDRWLDIRTVRGQRPTRKRIQWDADLRSPAYERRLIREQLRKPTDRVRVKIFKPELNQAVETMYTAQRFAEVKLHDGRRTRLLEIQVTQQDLPTIRHFVDDSGTILRSETDFLGQKLVSYRVPEQVAVESLVGAELDQAVLALISTDKIPRPERARKIVYLVSVADQQAWQLFPTSAIQQVSQADDDRARITVLATPPASAERVPSVDRQYLASNSLINTEDFRVRSMARKAAAGRSQPLTVAQRCEAAVFRQIKTKDFSTAFAGAAETARKLEGDCTEHAVLLAALLRVNQIPSRVVAGLVYTEPNGVPSFAGHMWTEAWVNQRWIGLDATLGRGSVGAARIRIADSSLADDAPVPASLFLPLLKLSGKIEIRIDSID